MKLFVNLHALILGKTTDLVIAEKMMLDTINWCAGRGGTERRDLIASMKCGLMRTRRAPML
jgi:hypothetical protein